MPVPGFEEDITGLPSESISSGTKCIVSRVFDLESTTTKEFRSIDVRLTAIEAMQAATFPHLATKADLHKLETELLKRHTEVQAEMGSMQASLRAEMSSMQASLRAEMSSMQASLRADMGKMQTTLTKWFVATSFATMAIVVALIGSSLFRGSLT